MRVSFFRRALWKFLERKIERIFLCHAILAEEILFCFRLDKEEPNYTWNFLEFLSWGLLYDVFLKSSLMWV